MKNIINTNYKPQHTPKDIYRFMSVFQTALKEEIQDKLSLFEVEVPLYSTDKIVSDIYEMIESRPITFGTATDNEVYSMYNKYDY
jgi:ABC-type transporter MlaC component